VRKTLLLVIINIKIMKKTAIRIMFVVVVLFGSLVFLKSANADVIIPGQTQNTHTRPIPGNIISSSTPSNIKVSTFTNYLKIGASGQDVKNLQIFLNSQGFTVSASGAGSPGSETSYFGPATYRSLIKFQNYYASSILAPVGLTQGTGYFGPSTVNKVNQIIGNQ
jgi:peptidoglycan hydrolase-like protein with peptidoglycan-binding domain